MHLCFSIGIDIEPRKNCVLEQTTVLSVEIIWSLFCNDPVKELFYKNLYLNTYYSQERKHLKGAQAWDVRRWDFYWNQACMGRWLRN
jgi:hypothetical protein